MNLFLHIIFWFILILSIFIIPFNLPGTFVIVVATFGYQFFDQTAGIKWGMIIILLGIALVLELFEYAVTAWISQKYGGSYGTVGAIAGSIIGAIFGTSIIPFLGSILGAFIGGFAGAYILEYIGNRDKKRAYSVGKGALIGVVSGKTSKIIGAIIMVIIISTMG